jgi:hypothetical protein
MKSAPFAPPILVLFSLRAAGERLQYGATRLKINYAGSA